MAITICQIIMPLAKNCKLAYMHKITWILGD